MPTHSTQTRTPLVRHNAFPPTAPPRVRRVCLIALLAIAFLFASSGWNSIQKRWADFEYFYKASAWLVHNGTMDPEIDRFEDGGIEARGGIPWYLPFVPRVFSVVSWMPMRVAGTIWLIFNLVLFFATLRLIGRYLSGLPPGDWMVTQLVPVLFLLAAWHWEFRLNQINNLTLFLLVASFALWRRGRPNVSGLALGLAILVKLTPGLIAFWFLLKREFRVVGVAAVTVVVAGPLSDVIVFGPSYAADTYRAWARSALIDNSQRGLILRQVEMDWRNQAVGALASRWLHRTSYTKHFDNDPRIHLDDSPAWINVANLSLHTIAGGVLAFSAASVLLLVWVARHPARRLGEWRIRMEWALFVLAMLWLMPVMRRYHLIWALPAISVLGGAIHYCGLRNAWGKFALVCAASVCAAQLTLVLYLTNGTNLPEAAGVLLAPVLLLASALIWRIVTISRDPEAMPPPAEFADE